MGTRYLSGVLCLLGSWIMMMLSFPGQAAAQYGAIRIGTDFPLRYTLGYTLNPASRISFQANAGILTDPYDDIALRLLSHSGLDDDAIDVARDLFTFGAVYDVGANVNIGKGYIGLYGQVIHLFGADTSPRVIGNYLGIDLGDYSDPELDQSLTIQSTIYQAGLRIGARFPLSIPNLELHTELSISANISSDNTLSAEAPYPSWVGTQFNDDLRKTFRTYLYVPSIGVFLIYNLHE